MGLRGLALVVCRMPREHACHQSRCDNPCCPSPYPPAQIPPTTRSISRTSGYYVAQGRAPAGDDSIMTESRTRDLTLQYTSLPR